jgi:hypothetical protein
MTKINEIEIKRTDKESMKEKLILWLKKQDLQTPGKSD